MGKAIGIDLGTTNSVAGLRILETEIMKNREGDKLTPSCVGMKKTGLFKRKTILVGRPALDWRIQDPDNTIVSIKRLMGRNFVDPEVQRLIKDRRFNYRIKQLAEGSENSIAVLLGDDEYSPEEITAKILEKIKQDCEKSLKDTVEYAVVTVPAYFNDKQKHATRTAAALAGLKVERLLPEPTAAAICFGVDSLTPEESRTVLIYDFGGGTFDVSVLTIADCQFIEQAKGGDMWLGGDDIDSLMIDYVYEQTSKANDLESIIPLIEKLPETVRKRFSGELSTKVQAAKITLSLKKTANVEIIGLLKDDDGDMIDVDVEINRSTFDELISPMVEKTLVLTEEILKDINFDSALIDQVLMIGGSSCIPLVVGKVKSLFGEDKVLVHPRPMFAVAEGAAIMAHRLSSEKFVDSGSSSSSEKQFAPFDQPLLPSSATPVEIVHSTSHDYYLKLENEEYYLLVERNTILPSKTSKVFSLVHKHQQLAHFRFHNKVEDHYESIGDLWLSFDYDMIKKDNNEDQSEIPQVILDLNIDADNIITISARLKDCPEVNVTRTLSRGGIDQKLYLELERSIDQVNLEKHDLYVGYDFGQRAVRIAREINRVMDPNTDEVRPDILTRVTTLQKTALKIVNLKLAPTSCIDYVEYFMQTFEYILPPAELETLEQMLANLKEKNLSGTIEEIETELDNIYKELDRYSTLKALLNINQAADICYGTDPKKAARFGEYYSEIFSELTKGNVSQITKLFDEILPEVSDVLKQRAETNETIWKGIGKQ